MVVLIADDDPVSRRALEAALTGWGYDVEVVNDGQQALDALLRESAPARLAVLDWMMPGLDGPEVCRIVRARSQGPYAWLLLLTARKKGSDLIAGLEAGADDYIRKPFDPGELKGRLRVGERILALEAQLLEAQKALHVLATRDELTGLYNRRAVMERLDEEIERAARDGGKLCVLLMDVDHFKHLNDDRGHLAGDEVLRKIAVRLERVAGPDDALGRYGGDELIAILPGRDSAAAIALAEKMREAAAAPIATQAGPLSMTVSIGCGTWSPGEAATVLIANADVALYRAKAAGRNRVEGAP
ncbi:MAG: diguanylate cyclase [Deltaproteobacteria bacterium]|nr:MAG: diguanylate cyclase [Deltaproteobacteria bacterium]TMB37803.1 MAG: diguanylate cyclase [Deltaproteobacteria bacterium]